MKKDCNTCEYQRDKQCLAGLPCNNYSLWRPNAVARMMGEPYVGPRTDYTSYRCVASSTIDTLVFKQITNVIFNPPATIVFWGDGTKTVVKCQADDVFDPEKGLAMAIAKKFFDNKGSYCNQIKPWIEKWEEEQKKLAILDFSVSEGFKRAAESLQKLADSLHKKDEKLVHIKDEQGLLNIETGEKIVLSNKRTPLEEAYWKLVTLGEQHSKEDLQAAIDETIGYLGQALAGRQKAD